jgi:hypothetical protein
MEAVEGKTPGGGGIVAKNKMIDINEKCTKRSGAGIVQSAKRLDYRLDDREFDSWQGQEIFSFSTASRPALGPTQLLLPRMVIGSS